MQTSISSSSSMKPRCRKHQEHLVYIDYFRHKIDYSPTAPYGLLFPDQSVSATSLLLRRKLREILDLSCSVIHSTQHTHLKLARSGWTVIFLALLSQIACIEANPVQTAGPLGNSPGNSQGTIPAGGSANATSSPGSTFSPGIQGLDTLLAAFSALFITITYAVLIGPGTRLSSTSKIPLASLEGHIGNMLSKIWPDTSNSTDIGGTPEDGDVPDAIRLVYVGKMDDERARVARGVNQCEAVPDNRVVTPPMWLTTGSSLTKSIVQLAVWEWISIWMAIAMLVSTLAFNGFFTNNRAPDSSPRLVVVVIYLAAFCLHVWYVWKKCRSFFTLASAGASWSMLNKASFASVDLGTYNNRLSGGPAPVFRQVGKPASSAVYPAYEACLLQDVGLPQNEMGVDPASDDEQKGAIETVNAWQKREVTSTVEAGGAALDLVVTNVMTMVGITITTGFSVWTSNTSSDSSQLGSLALLASLTLGTGAMFSSAVHLSIMDSSFTNVLYLKEIMINGQASAHVTKRSSKKRVIGFAHKSVDTKAVGIRDLAKSSTLWSFLVFGPAYTLLPSEADHARQSEGASFELNVRVRDDLVVLTTESTNRHSKRVDGANVEAINVFCTPKKHTSPPAKPIKTVARVESTAIN
jgi:hypothetical protein